MTLARGKLGLGLLVGAAIASPPRAAAEVLGEDRVACAPGGGPAVEISVSGWKDRKGDLRIELYPAAQEDFLKDDNVLRKEGKFFRRVTVPIPASGPVAVCIKAPRPGAYGLFVNHNRDGHNAFGIFEDGAGIASNRKLGRSKPRLDVSTVEVPQGVAVVNVRLQYFTGFGFGPIKGRE